MVKAWVRLLRLGNLLFIGAIPLILHYGYLEPLFQVALSDLHVVLLSVALICISASGNIINDIYDQHADSINKPGQLNIGKFISERTAFIVFGILAITGLLVTIFIGIEMGQEEYIYLYPISMALLWLYTIDFKGRILIGNVIISFLAGLNIFLLAVIDILPVYAVNIQQQEFAWNSIGLLSLFAFLTTLIRETVKDLEDKDGDNRAGYRTIGTRWPVRYAKALILGLMSIEVAGLIWVYAQPNSTSIGYHVWMIGLLIVPVLYMAYRLVQASTSKHYDHIATILKYHMLIGLITPVALRFIFTL